MGDQIQGSRKFYDFKNSAKPHLSEGKNEKDGENAAKIANYIRTQLIGEGKTFKGPYGHRKIVYCDYIASGRSLKFIEDYICREVLPHYGNTHTTTSVTSMQTTLYRHEARDIVRNACNASEQDSVIFSGNGCTGAVRKLINALGWSSANSRPIVVFVSLQEHHSNLLPWRRLPNATVVTIEENRCGQVSVESLENQLKNHGRNDAVLVGCFPAASNITGVLNDDLAITALMHQYGGLAFWDYATAAPYVRVDVNPRVSGDSDALCHKDAVYFSFHKFVGGVQTPGVLIAKKSLFRNPVPENGGGGGFRVFS